MIAFYLLCLLVQNMYICWKLVGCNFGSDIFHWETKYQLHVRRPHRNGNHEFFFNEISHHWLDFFLEKPLTILNTSKRWKLLKTKVQKMLKLGSYLHNLHGIGCFWSESCFECWRSHFSTISFTILSMGSFSNEEIMTLLCFTAKWKGRK